MQRETKLNKRKEYNMTTKKTDYYQQFLNVSKELQDADKMYDKAQKSINLLEGDLIDAKMERDIFKEKVTKMIIEETLLNSQITNQKRTIEKLRLKIESLENKQSY